MNDDEREPTITEWQECIREWSEPIFTQSTLATTLAHFELEVAEIRRAWEAGDYANTVEECADALIMLIQFCNKCGIELGPAIMEKMAINVNREWLPPNEDGIVFHKKEE